MNIRLSLDSYDRFFPSQDYVPKGGFGNLIALPLQKAPRENGNSCFLDQNLNPIQDQWAYLYQVRRLSLSEIRKTLDSYLPKLDYSGRSEAFDDVSWITDKAIIEKTTNEKIEYSLDGSTIEIVFGPMIVVPLTGLPGKVVAKLKKKSSFPNPEFYKRQRMRLQTYPEPRFIFSGEMRPEEIILPRGVLDEVVKILTIAGAKVIIRDERIAKRKIKATFSRELTEMQKIALKSLKSYDLGVLCAPPGSGKTVMGCALIAERKVSTLVLVDKQLLLEQWKKQISHFLGIPIKEIGTMSGTKKKLTGRIDVASLRSLKNVEDLNEIASQYSQIIIDECHHIPATTFEDILKQLPARYIWGLTATPYRKDGLEKILFHQCGPIRHEINSVDGGTLQKYATIHETGFRTPDEAGERPPYHVLIHYLVNDNLRNNKIKDRVIQKIDEKRFPLLISDRKNHLDSLQELIRNDLSTSLQIVRLDGDLTGKQRRLALEEIQKFKSESKPVLLMATASLIGEGFDLPELDTLIFTTPISFEGRMTQYAGRIHRPAIGKKNVEIIDFVDSYNAMLLKMYRNRIKAYKKMGYIINSPSDSFPGRLF